MADNQTNTGEWIEQLILQSAKMALRHYGDLRDADTGQQMSASDKEDIINCNESSWIKRVKDSISTDTEDKYASGAQLIKQLKEYWDTHPIKNDDEDLWNILRSADKSQWQSLIGAVAQLLRDGYEHKVWNKSLCQTALLDLLAATESDKWNTVMNEAFKGKSHRFKTQIWKVSRMAVEIVEPFTK